MYLCYFKDALGMPRAWAIAPTMEAAGDAARRQLDAYKKGQSYEPSVQDPFHCELLELPSGDEIAPDERDASLGGESTTAKPL